MDVSRVRKIPRFAGLSPSAESWLCERLKVRRYDRKESVFREGEVCNRLILIEQGAITVFKTLESGRELALNIFRGGDAVGEIALIDRDVFPASAIALEDSLTVELAQADYFEVTRLYPEVAFATIRDLTQRVRSMTHRIQELGSGSVESRLAQFFLTLARNSSSSRSATNQEVEIRLTMSRQDLANMIGVRVETVIRCMSRWQKNDVILTHDNGFTVPSLRKLEEILSKDF